MRGKGPMSLGRWSPVLLGALLLAGGPGAALAQTEMHFQYGSIANPFAETTSRTSIVTIQHASSWRFGDNFFFLDLIRDGDTDGFNDNDAYGEWYSNFSLGKLSGRDLGFGPFADFGLFWGAGFGADANVLNWFPGARVAWNLPGFVFLNTDLMIGVDAGGGLAGGAPPEQDTRFIIDVNGLLPFSLGSQAFSITGHAEYAAPTTDELGNDVPSSILAQPQLRWDVGAADGLFVGIEYQYWRNKLGTDVDENVVQLLGVWRF